MPVRLDQHHAAPPEDHPSSAQAAGVDRIVAPEVLDPAGVDALQRHIARAQAAASRRILLDVSATSGPDTRTLSLLCTALRPLARCGPPIAIAGASPHVRRVLELCAIDGLMLLAPSSPGDRGSPSVTPRRRLRPAAAGRLGLFRAS